MQKKAGAKLTLIISIMIVVILILISLLFLTKDVGTNPVKEFVKNVIEVVTGKENPDESEITEPVPTFSSGGGGSGGSGGGGGSSGGDSSGGTFSPNCHSESISYSLEELGIEEVCNEYDNETCINKDLNCSVKIINRDYVGGNFGVIIYFVEKEKSQTDAFDSKSTQVFIPSQEYFFFQYISHVESTGVDGLANKDLTCFFNTLEVPKKEICS